MATRIALVFLASLLGSFVSIDNLPTGVDAYPSNLRGYDISWPQCTTGYPGGSLSFTIIGVTLGRAYTRNPCLGDEVKWARQQGAAVAPGLYMNLDLARVRGVKYGMSGPKGDCKTSYDECMPYNYGYNSAKDAFTYAVSQGVVSGAWWLDIEDSNSWSDYDNLNVAVVQGALDYFADQHIAAGIYSMHDQWTEIMGDYKPVMRDGSKLQNWVATPTSGRRAPGYCSSDYAFGGGEVRLVQYIEGSYDISYAC